MKSAEAVGDSKSFSCQIEERVKRRPTTGKIVRPDAMVWMRMRMDSAVVESVDAYVVGDVAGCRTGKRDSSSAESAGMVWTWVLALESAGRDTIAVEVVADNAGVVVASRGAGRHDTHAGHEDGAVEEPGSVYLVAAGHGGEGLQAERVHECYSSSEAAMGFFGGAQPGKIDTNLTR